MDMATLRAFFMWCAILNGGLLILTSLIFMVAGKWAYRVHTIWFKMPRETFNVVIYSFIGIYKILIFVFNLVPYIVLVILG